MIERAEAHINWKEREIHKKTYEYFGYHNGEPVYREIWIREISKFPYCSNCGGQTDDRFMHYCSKCGAKFIGGKHD